MQTSWTSLAAYLHDIDPYAIMLWPDGPIRWYGLAYLAGFVVAYLVIRRIARVGVSSLAPAQVGDFVMVAAIGLIIGGRLGYVVFYQPSLLIQFDHRLPYWGALAINRGGMASHGGLLGAILACLWYARRHNHQALYLMDLAMVAMPVGVFFGRIANFINGELFGRACDPNLPWAVKFPQEMYEWSFTRKQVFLDRIARYLPADFDPARLPSWTIQQIQSGNTLVADAVRDLLTPRHPSQIYAALLEGLLMFIVAAIVYRKPRKPGTMVAVGCIGYGIARIIDEQWRQPDEQIGFHHVLGITFTHGQMLSAAMIVVGIVAAILVYKSKRAPQGGWRKSG